MVTFIRLTQYDTGKTCYVRADAVVIVMPVNMADHIPDDDDMKAMAPNAWRGERTEVATMASGGYHGFVHVRESVPTVMRLLAETGHLRLIEEQTIRG